MAITFAKHMQMTLDKSKCPITFAKHMQMTLAKHICNFGQSKWP